MGRSRAAASFASVFAPLSLVALLLVGANAFAHERFVPHRLKNPLCLDFFKQTEHGWLFGIHPDTWQIAAKVFVIMVVAVFIWFVRQPIEEFLLYRVANRFGGRVQKATHAVTSFLTDKPIQAGWFRSARELAVAFFLRSAALVLMYSATNDALVMPSYPLDPSTATLFKFVQAFLAILILAQAALPFVGAVIFGTWIYMMWKWGLMVSIDAAPVLTVAVVYITSPWQSHRAPITRINEDQMRWLRRVLGAGFAALGWLKLYNHDLTAGVADNFPSAMEDPMVQMLAFGTDPGFIRENWVVAFGMAEVMCGCLLMMGVFARFWSVIMTAVFTKLMIVDFGWEEIPHIYPIGAMLVIALSNTHSSEFDAIESVEERHGAAGRTWKQSAVILGAATAAAFVIIFPGLYTVTGIVSAERPQRGLCVAYAGDPREEAE